MGQINRKVLLWLSAAAVVAVLVAYQTLGSTAAKHAEIVARADVPTVQPGTECDVYFADNAESREDRAAPPGS